MKRGNQRLLLLAVLMLVARFNAAQEACRPQKCVCDRTTLSCNSSSIYVVPRSGMSVKTTILHLANNNIGIVEDKAFLTLVNLTELDLSSNKIRAISIYAFRDLKKLNTLVLNVNQIPFLDSYLIEDLSMLEVLLIKTNNITAVGQHSLDYLVHLKHLDLSLNFIKSIHRHAFTKLGELKILNLEGNSLVTASPKWFTSSSLTSLTLVHNKWKCDCNMTEYFNWYHNKTGNFNQPHVTRSLNIYCKSKHTHFNSLKEKDLTCETAVTPTGTSQKGGGNYVISTTTTRATVAATTKANIKHFSTSAPPSPSNKPIIPTIQHAHGKAFSGTHKPKTHTPGNSNSRVEIPVESAKPISVVSGKDAKLHCPLSGVSTVVWRKDGVLLNLKHPKHRYISKSTKLTIKAVKISDKGKYCCFKAPGRNALKKCLQLTAADKPKKVATKTARTNTVVIVVIVFAVIITLLGLGVYCIKRAKRIRRERYGLLSDSRAFDAVHSDVTMRPPNSEVSEDYV